MGYGGYFTDSERSLKEKNRGKYNAYLADSTICGYYITLSVSQAGSVIGGTIVETVQGLGRLPFSNPGASSQLWAAEHRVDWVLIHR